jgi:transmembrane sensor
VTHLFPSIYLHKNVESSWRKGKFSLTVAHEMGRQFIVSTKGGYIRDIGTRFSVYTQVDQVFIAVEEGAVEIDLDPKNRRARTGHIRHLIAGERIAYTSTGIWSEVEPISPHLIATWRKGKLIFEGMPLSAVIQEVKRYWPGQVILADHTLADTKVKGVFDIENLSGFFQALPQILPVQVTQTEQAV